MKYTFNLIDGAFDAEESKQILLTLIADKVNFHHRKNFSNNERFGQSDVHSDQRIAQLEAVATELAEFIANLDSDAQLKISAKVDVAIVAKS